MSSDVDVVLAAGRFELGDLTEAPAAVSHAWSNEVFRVTTTTGTYAIKLYPRLLSDVRCRQLAAGMEFEEAVLRAGRVPVPQPTAVADRWLVEFEAPSGPRLARCHRWVAGMSARVPLGLELLQCAGRYLGFLHAMNRPGGDTSQLPGFAMDRWDRAVRAAAERRLGWAVQLAALTPLIRRLAADLDVLREERRPMRISHRDYDPKNAVVDVAGRLVITDWDYAGPVLPDVELIVAATSFADTDAAVVSFVRAYRDAGGDAPAADRLALTSELADVDWLLRNVEGCLTDDRHATRAHYHSAGDLIASFPSAVAALREWPDRLARMRP